MKRIISVGLVVIIIAGLLSGCGKSFDAEQNTVYVQKKGTIIGAAIEKLDKEYYQEEELKEFVETKVAEYQKKHEKKSVKLDDFSVKEDVAKLFIKYAGYEDYQNFNEVILFAGTVPEALAAGYDFNTTFTKIKDGKASGSAASDKLKDTDYKVVILNEKIEVKVDGEIQYISSDFTTMKSKDTVSVKLTKDAQDGEELSLVYLLYE